MSNNKSETESKGTGKPKSKKRSPRSKAKANGQASPRKASQGDTSPSVTPAGIERFTVSESILAAQEAKITAVKDIISGVPPHDVNTLAKVLHAVMEGTSSDDAAVLRNALLGQNEVPVNEAGPAPDDMLSASWRSGGYPYRNLMTRKAYEKQKYKLQVELLKLQQWVKKTGERVVILFEGRDAAGKGGTIKRFMEHLNPRGARVVALEKPTVTEQGQWYFQRYVEHLPTRGEIILFDRSWYNRAGVERVMGFCDQEEYNEFMRQVPEFERNLVRSGIHLTKFWFSVSRKEQRRRFKERERHPLKQWKLSPIDLASLDMWDEYTKAKEAMFQYTDSVEAPWTVVKSDCKKRARLNALRYVLHSLPYDNKNLDTIGSVDPLLVGRAQVRYAAED
ncbi:polyphosphate kinase 2 [Fuerstiella marisgermanici]|uniref:ADP/GDP-polyphosphate phosphotransferase n=1 Tax=Fuerstiella marisgermanici TaxID=1891926 RepID=A0A1P8WMJ0_9PLAN|nr:polyphosphate kinase 2 [Fuerstiella marisgermanici]APZ95268.1 polyphosphate kinase 2 [Fuerstiella marisgermanici]